MRSACNGFGFAQCRARAWRGSEPGIRRSISNSSSLVGTDARPRLIPREFRPVSTTARLCGNAQTYVQALGSSSTPNVEPANTTKKSSFTNPLEALAVCPGCGAFAQIIEPDVAGFYSLKREAVRAFLQPFDRDHDSITKENAIFVEAIQNAGPALQDELSSASADKTEQVQHPLCDRCHNLLHHHRGTPIAHPSLDSLAETFAESPYKHNHIYHVLDAADFPMSVVPGMQRILSVAPQRSRNRRARNVSYSRGKKTEMSFIITRSDLLAPKKEQVDHLMPYLVEILRDALGRSAQHVRLGNVRCVSAKRGWWTKEVKTDVWKRGGGGWMVGKVNVGKSNLFEVIFPKARNQEMNFDRTRSQAHLGQGKSADTLIARRDHLASPQPELNLLPPAREEKPYPTMPTVSSLPGTTASPIRIPFGGGKGELIDLPGLERSSIGSFIQDDKQESVIMKKRVVPEQISIPPGSSLLLGGLVRITSRNQQVYVLAYPFVPLQPHLTRTEKAVEAEQGQKSPIPFITREGVSNSLRSAGVFELNFDVTRQRAGPLIAKDAVALKPQNLPFKVLSTDILIESIGWIELVAQVRRRDFPDDAPLAGGASYPAVEVFSPEGKFITSRRSMGAWDLGKPRKTSIRKRVHPINRRLKERRKSSKGVA